MVSKRNRVEEEKATCVKSTTADAVVTAAIASEAIVRSPAALLEPLYYTVHLVYNCDAAPHYRQTPIPWGSTKAARMSTGGRST